MKHQTLKKAKSLDYIVYKIVDEKAEVEKNVASWVTRDWATDQEIIKILNDETKKHGPNSTWNKVVGFFTKSNPNKHYQKKIRRILAVNMLQFVNNVNKSEFLLFRPLSDIIGQLLTDERIISECGIVFTEHERNLIDTYYTNLVEMSTKETFVDEMMVVLALVKSKLIQLFVRYFESEIIEIEKKKFYLQHLQSSMGLYFP